MMWATIALATFYLAPAPTTSRANPVHSNLFEIVQTKTQIALYSEKNHDVRTIIIGERPPHEPPSWTGDSYGHWKGSTLVVETQGFRDGLVNGLPGRGRARSPTTSKSSIR